MATDLYHPAWCITVDHDRDNGILREVTFSCHTLPGERIFGLDSTSKILHTTTAKKVIGVTLFTKVVQVIEGLQAD